MISSLGENISRYPTSFGIWAALILELTAGTYEIAVLGNNYQELQLELFKHYLPHRVFMASNVETEEFPILAGKISTSKPAIFLCKDFVCQQPVDSIKRFMSLIDRVGKQ